MKKIYGLGIALTLILSVGAAHAIGLGNITGNSHANKVINNVGSSVALDQMNKKLAQKSAKCKCDTKTGQISGCNLGAIRSTLDANKTGVKMAFNRSFKVRAKTNRACYDTLRQEIPASSSYWGWYYSKYNGTDVKIWGEK